MSLKINVFLCAAILAMGHVSAYADGQPDDPRSKENPKFEAQSQGNFMEIVDGIATYFTKYSDGTIQATQNAVLSDEETGQNLDVNIETRILSLCEGDHHPKICSPEDPADRITALVLPIEARVRVNLNGHALDRQGVQLKDLRIGLFRKLFQEIGLSVQVLSYVYQNADLKLGDTHRVELTSLDFNDVTPIDSSGNFEFVLKATGQFSWGTKSYLTAAKQAVVENTSGIKSVEYLDSRNDVGVWSPGSFVAGGTGSIGIRVAKRVLFEMFGGISTIYASNDEWEESSYDSPTVASVGTVGALTEKTLGAGVRFTINDHVNVRFSAEKDWYAEAATSYLNIYKTKEKPENTEDGEVSYKWSRQKKATVSQDREAIVGNLGLELRW